MFGLFSTDKISLMISYIADHLYIGEQGDAQSPPPFIHAVLWTALDPSLTPPPNVIFGRLPLKEYTEPDLIDLEIGVEWLARQLPEHDILVACRMGLGRSPSLIIAYLCCAQGFSFTEARELVTQKRPGTTALPRLASLIKQLTSPALTR